MDLKFDNGKYLILSQKEGASFQGKIYIADYYTRDMSVTSSQIAPSSVGAKRAAKSTRPFNETLHSQKLQPQRQSSGISREQLEELLYSTGGKRNSGANRRTLSIASGIRKPDDVFSNASQNKSNAYKYKRIDRNFKNNNTLTGTASNYEYDAFKD